ncbi:P1 family peptidase [Candidatus Viridilinea mediisalina]|uniref:Peptidase S58 n=1 Tax=Candidatus Viridilinea mediisalina TaxID=2024553 RepID=A0A2A6RFZ9_9CHLR|nr:P1 family peptidase [Candidatus Viridilinea mediisalina]PDW01863.1 peptidase S58 [Candidatus Viridilinea mediisalina]
MSPSLTDVPGFHVGHAHDLEALTGVTVVLPPAGTLGSVDVRGGAPATRETDLLAPEMLVAEVHGVVLCGGSALGLDAAAGVVAWLREQGRGFDVGVARVPIVPAAALFDLAVGQAERFPDAAMGYAACVAATSAAVAEGCVGAGTGATVGKLLGMARAMKAGIGSWSERLPDGTMIGALVAVNALGDVWSEEGQLLAGVRHPQHGGMADAMTLLRDPEYQQRFPWAGASFGGNTTLAVVATDATLDKAGARKLAQMAQAGLARSIRPIHTPLDGDSVFALASGQRPAPHMLLLGSIAAAVLARAVARAVQSATSMGGVPAAAG